jgi:hypothetical protein
LVVQIFLSYARIDDEVPSHVADGKGFVTCLYQDLRYSFRQRGDVETKIWRDTRRIDPADQFDAVIQRDIDASDLFLVVLSPNWMSRPYCKLELERFRDRWKHEGEEKLKHRIIVASKRYVEPQKRYSLLQGQTGHNFFAVDGPGETGPEYEYFDRGKVRDDRYYDSVEGVARSLYLRAQQLGKKDGQERQAIEEREEQYSNTRAGATQAKTPAHANGQKVYLAKPASDMREAYSRLVDELAGAGYAIVPDPGTNIPYDSSAARFIDEALAGADLSIHLIGEGAGYTPELSDPIVKLQLARSKARAGAANGAGNGSQPAFRRIIWAPEIVEGDTDQSDSAGQSAQADPNQAPAAKKREPQEVLARFGDYLPTTDKVLGGVLSKFVDFIVEHIAEQASLETLPESLAEDGWVYVYHEAADSKYAIELTKALRQRGIAADLPALEGPTAEVIANHDRCLLECNAVVLCWANASEVWARARAHQLNWKRLGRTEKFAYRGLFAGPPPGDRKSIFVELPPPNEIDVIVDLTKDEKPLAEAIEPFVQRARPHGP